MQIPTLKWCDRHKELIITGYYAHVDLGDTVFVFDEDGERHEWVFTGQTSTHPFFYIDEESLKRLAYHRNFCASMLERLTSALTDTQIGDMNSAIGTIIGLHHNIQYLQMDGPYTVEWLCQECLHRSSY